MIGVAEDPGGGNRWLRVDEDGVRLIGAHLVAGSASGAALTVMWDGRLDMRLMAEFCQSALVDQVAMPTLELRSRVFVEGETMLFEGSRWLEAAVPGAPLVRFDRGTAWPGETPVSERSFALWGASARADHTADDEENIGILLGPPALMAWRTELADLIAQTHLLERTADAFQEALASLLSYLAPRPRDALEL